VDILPDIEDLLNSLSESETQIETRRSGPFTFRLGVDGTALAPLYQRVLDAHERLNVSPLSQVARQLEREVVASSIFGTNSIEGGTLTEEETQQVLDLDPAQVREEEQLRAVNLKAAYDVAQQAATTPDWRLKVPFIQKVHAAITQGLTYPHNQPGVFRDNPKALKTHVGNPAHGGRYQPPQHGHDIETLMQALASWHQELAAHQVPALIRAPLVHYYYELIHPFWDGNGRVGRVLEAALLQADGFQYAPFALARYYPEVPPTVAGDLEVSVCALCPGAVLPGAYRRVFHAVQSLSPRCEAGRGASPYPVCPVSSGGDARQHQSPT